MRSFLPGLRRSAAPPAHGGMTHRARTALLAAAFGTALLTGCAHGGPKAAPAAPKNLTVATVDNPDDAPEEAKTVRVEYTFPSDVVNKDFEAKHDGGFDKKGVKVDEHVVARGHFDVKDTKITGTVTYVKKGAAHYSVLAAELVVEGHYDASAELELDVDVKGDWKTATEKEWDKSAVGGKPVTLVKNLLPTNIPVGGPLFVNVHFDLLASCEMKAQGSFRAKTGVGVAGDVKLTARYDKKGFEKPGGKRSRFAFSAEAPAFELRPKPYLSLETQKAAVEGRCSLQPTAVVLLEGSVGAKLSVEPYVAFKAQRGASGPVRYQADAGFELVAATDVEIFGRPIMKPKEFSLFDKSLAQTSGVASPMPPRAASPSAMLAAAPRGRGAAVAPIGRGSAPRALPALPSKPRTRGR